MFLHELMVSITFKMSICHFLFHQTSVINSGIIKESLAINDINLFSYGVCQIRLLNTALYRILLITYAHIGR